MTLPRSVARTYDPFLAAFITLVVYGIGLYNDTPPLPHALFLIAAVTLPMLLCEWCRNAPHFPPRPAIGRRTLLQTVATKWLGVMACALVCLFVWWLIPMYHSEYFKPLFICAPYAYAALALLLIPYLYYTERRLGIAHDYAWHIGRRLLFKSDIDWRLVRDGALSALVRALFLSLNVCYLVYDLDYLSTQPPDLLLFDMKPQTFALIMSYLELILITAIIPGYLLSLRLINTHTRAIDRSWLGWTVTMACYMPFNNAVFDNWFAYTANAPDGFMRSWMIAFHDTPALLITAGITILAMQFLHMWGESILGIRSSNLTHRGIITNGPFRYLRHPVYLSKCIAWCIIFVPFLSGDTAFECLRLTLLFVGVCMIYYLRALAEERMLSVDPTYIAYALYLDQHGLLAPLGRRIPALTFAWRHAHWHTRS